MKLNFDLWSYLWIKEQTKHTELFNPEIQTGYLDPQNTEVYILHVDAPSG